MLIAKIILLSIICAYLLDFIAEMVISKRTYGIRMLILCVAVVTFITIQWLI